MSKQPIIQGQDILILSTQDWDYLPTRKHRFSRWWAQDGNRVLYVEQQMHWAGWLVDLKNQFGRLWRWLSGPREVEPNLWVYTLPLVIPFFQMSAAINWLNNLFLLLLLRAQLKRLGFESPVLWTYTPHSADFVGRLGERAVVYECVDDITSAKGLVDAKAIGKMERRLIEVADLLIVTHDQLYASKADEAKRALVVPNGVDVEHFSQAASDDRPVAPAFADLKHPVVGYLGGINYWIDTELVARIARTHPEWTVAMVGPAEVLANMEPLNHLPNVVKTGRVPYADVPSYVKAFDVCINPYVLDGVAEHCSPLKLYEYVATGKPIVSVDMPEAHKFSGLIQIARDADSFVRLVEEAVNSPDGRNAERIAEAKNHTWRSRFVAASQALSSIL